MRYRLVIATTVLFVLICVSGFLPGARLWGINHLAFYSPMLRVLAMALVGATLIPAVSRRLFRLATAVLETLADRTALRYAIVAAAAVAAATCFYVFHSSTQLLGDGQLVLTTLQARLNEAIPLASTVVDIVRVDHVSPGTTILYLLVAKATGTAPIETVRIVNSVLGTTLVITALLLASRRSVTAGVRLWLVTLIFTSGVLQLFFGYVENYGPLVAFALLYVAAAVAHLRAAVPLWLPFVLFVAMLLCHVEGILLGPSLLYLLMWRFLNRRPRALRWMVPATTVAAVAATIFVATATDLGRLVLAATARDGTGGFLSPGHWIDVVNEVLLLAPTAPIAVALALSARRTSTAPAHEPSGGTWAGAAAVPHFIAVLAIPCVLYLALFNAELGISRDWDLFAINIVWIVPASLLAGERAYSRNYNAFALGIIPALAAGAVLVTAWVGINATPVRTIERLQTTLEYDDAMSPYIYENLSIHFENEGDLPRAITALEQAYEKTQNHRRALNLSLLYKQVGDSERAHQLLRRTLRSRPKFERARRVLVLSLNEDQLYDELVDVATVGTSHHADTYFYHYYLGRAFAALGRREDAAAALLTARSLQPPAPVRDEITDLLRSLGK